MGKSVFIIGINGMIGISLRENHKILNELLNYNSIINTRSLKKKC
jgi:hypothetical protein